MQDLKFEYLRIFGQFVGLRLLMMMWSLRKAICCSLYGGWAPLGWVDLWVGLGQLFSGLGWAWVDEMDPLYNSAVNCAPCSRIAPSA